MKVMLQAANRTKEGWLVSINNFPCEDLRTIDQLWLKYSNGKFGFSVQAKIYRELSGTREYNERVWNAFGDRVGWRVNNWIYSYWNCTFDLKAPLGHLPFLLTRADNRTFDSYIDETGTLRRGHFVGGALFYRSLASRLVECNI